MANIGRVGTPRWAQHTELRDYQNHPEGNENVGDRACMDIYINFTVQHDYATGIHASAGCLISEPGTYQGDGADPHNISLDNASLDISWLLICRADSEYPVFASTDMTADNTKEEQTASFQSNQIQSIGTGTFQVGSDTAVNESGVTYYYFAVGI